MMAFENRGVMLDASRLLEKKSYYYSLLPWLKKWGYNILHFHFADDNGCAIVMPSHPTLAKDAAFTVEEITDFIRVAGEHGLTVIPELECLGHTKFITTAPGYEHLGGSSADTSGFNSLNPELDGTRVILTELLKDVADIFPSDIIHVGLDEVDMSGIEAYKGLSRDDQWKPFAAHAAWVHEEVRRLGKRPGMWGDHILKTPAMLTEFKTDVLMFDWHYDANVSPASLELFLEKGFEVWGCPASVQWNDKLIASEHNQLQNLRDFSAIALDRKERGCTGMVNTIWCPWRYLSGVMDLPMALGGHLFSEMDESSTFAVDFCRDFYALDAVDASACADAILGLHRLGKNRHFHHKLIKGIVDDNTAVFNREERRICAHMEREAAKAIAVLRPIVAQGSLHSERLNDYVLTGQMIETLARLGAHDFDSAYIGDIDTLIADLDTSWQRTKDEEWDTGDYPYMGVEWPLRAMKNLSLIKAKVNGARDDGPCETPHDGSGRLGGKRIHPA